MAKKLISTPLSISEANAFVESFHRHNLPTLSGKFAIGVSSKTGLVGVAIVGRPIARMLQDGFTAEVLRVCTTTDAPKGSNSFLYSRCWRAARAMGYRKLITYTLQTESGSSLRGAGWEVVAEVKPKTNPWQSINRVREWRPIYGQLKLRWEIT